MKRKELILLGVILVAGIGLRIFSVFPYNTIIGFDQARDFFTVQKIIHGDLAIIGPTAGNNPNLHHGVAYFYYLLLPLWAGDGSPMWAVYWNLLFNAGVVVILYFLGKSLFNSKVGYLAAFLAAMSYQLVNFAGWLSNPSPALWSVPLFFLFLWKKKLPLAAFFLGLSIQFELFFIYLIPLSLIIWLALKQKLPQPKTLFYSLLSFSIATATMLATEIKFKLAGVKSILQAGSLVGGGETNFGDFVKRFFETFSLNLSPTNLNFGLWIGIALITILTISILKNKKERSPLIFLFIYLFSPSLMLFLGYHFSPWFLIGLPPATILATSYMLAKIKPKFILFSILSLIFISNMEKTSQMKGVGQPLLEPDPSAILSTQLAVINHTYQEVNFEKFSINSVTNPLYINAVWAYHYQWYGAKKYGFVPGWLGGDQLSPYNTLPKSENKEAVFFLIMDQTPRIPTIYIQEAVNWAKTKGKLINKKEFPGLTVQKFNQR